MSNNPCADCVTEVTLSSEQIGKLRSRDHGLTPVRELSFDRVATFKQAEPPGWLSKVADSIQQWGVFDALLLVPGPGFTELIDGNHRAYVAHSLGISVPAKVFLADCGTCTETMFRESAMNHTEKLGWRY